MEITKRDVIILRTGEASDAAELLTSILTQAVHEATEHALRALPGVIQSLIIQAAALKETRDKFYTEHKDLQGHEALVAATLERLEAQNPGITLDQLLPKLASEVKQSLALMQNTNLDTQGRPKKEDLDHLAGML